MAHYRRSGSDWENGMQTHYAFDDNAASTTVTDYENNVSGTASDNTTTLASKGPGVNKALDFNGTDEGVSIGDNYGINLGVASYSLWFNPDDNWNTGLGTNQALFRKLKAANYDFWFGHSNGDAGKVTLTIVNVPAGETGGSSISLSSNTNSFPSGNWHHIVITHDWNAGETKMYINGKLEVETSTTITTAPADDSTGYIGRSSAAGYYYDGRISNFRVWNKALRPGEVSALFRRRL